MDGCQVLILGGEVYPSSITNKLMDFEMIHKSFSLLLLVSLWIIPHGWAQSHYDPEDAPNPNSLSLLDQTKSDLYIITAAGLSGAVLGLSTLSFVDEPSKHWSNVWTGAAIGIIGGVVYVAYRQAFGPGGMWSDAPVPEENYGWRHQRLSEQDHFLASSDSFTGAAPWYAEFHFIF